MNVSYSTTSAPNESAGISSSAVEHLKSRFLLGLTKVEINSILAAATHRRYSANSVVANQGDPADYFFLLTKGCARLFYLTREGRKVLLRWLVPGEILGGAALLSCPSFYLVSTEMVRDSGVLVWRRNSIRALAGRYPKLLENALPFASDHLAWFLAAHMALVSKTARERLAQVLVSLAEGIGQRVSGGVRLDITNEQLANAANVTPFTASRLLSEWRRSGALAKGRGKLFLRAPNRFFSHPN